MKAEVILILLFVIVISFISADSTYCANVIVSNISPSSVGIGEDFTVGITIDSCGESEPENVVFSLLDVSPYISVKEPLTTTIEDFGYANSDRFLNYHMKTSSDAIPGEYKIKYRLVYGADNVGLTEEGYISITVNGEEAKLNIASVKTNPVLPKKGEEVELTLRIENYGDGTANSLKVYANHSFQGIKEAFIGTLESNEDGPAIFTFIPEQEGEFQIPVIISYEDDFGEHATEKTINIVILKSERNVAAIVSITALIIASFLLIFYFARRSRKKEKIIQQLMLGNHSETPKKKSKRK